MNMAAEIVDIDALQGWVGRTETARDLVTASALAGLSAALDRADPYPPPGAAALPGAHWVFFHPNARQSELDVTGHSSTGEFLPPAPLPRRMWAGGRLRFHRPLRVGESIERVSTIRDITVKQGRSGMLVFVLVHHAISGPDGLAVEEEHDIVYREAAGPGEKPRPPQMAPERATWTRTVTPDASLLFRFSALTFNASRIHYDYRYVTEVEGYPGLIVNARMVAIMLMEMCQAERPDDALTGFDFRFVRPLFDTAPFTLAGRVGDDAATASLWAADAEGHLSMTADARFG
jgi:3-methylfumaryl-CoA hydratase